MSAKNANIKNKRKKDYRKKLGKNKKKIKKRKSKNKNTLRIRNS